MKSLRGVGKTPGWLWDSGDLRLLKTVKHRDTEVTERECELRGQK